MAEPVSASLHEAFFMKRHDDGVRERALPFEIPLEAALGRTVGDVEPQSLQKALRFRQIVRGDDRHHGRLRQCFLFLGHVFSSFTQC